VRQFTFKGQDNYKILDSKRVFLGYGFWVNAMLKFGTSLHRILFEGKMTNQNAFPSVTTIVKVEMLPP
jgi:hypothetical protein